ncbi:hypothetical protein ACHAXR_005433 [Thalassiosira sp. AJA248-18]
MGNIESSNTGGEQNYWHGTSPNVDPSLRPPPPNNQVPLKRAASVGGSVTKGVGARPLLQRKGSSFLDEPVTYKITERGEAVVTLNDSPSSSSTADVGREGSPPSNTTTNTNKMRYAVSEMQGWRSHMEDKHVLNPKLTPQSNFPISKLQTELLRDHHLFAVFDGHGGDFASHYCGTHFVETLIGQKDWMAYLKLSSEECRQGAEGLTLLKDALVCTFHELDAKLMEAQRAKRLVQLGQIENVVHNMTNTNGNTNGQGANHEIFKKGSNDHNRVLNFDRTLLSSMPANMPLERSGSTAVVVLITPSHVVCANAGDSRAFLSKSSKSGSGGVNRTRSSVSTSGSVGDGKIVPPTSVLLPLSFDHKPNNDVEVVRVENDGGFVRNGRVDGDLAVSRSFGDFGYKNCSFSERGDDGSISLFRQSSEGSSSSSSTMVSDAKDHRVTVHPDILVHTRESTRDEFIVLACDGIWDRLTNHDCANLVRTLVHDDGETDVGLICEEIIDTALELDSRDNMTCCVVMFPGAKMGTPPFPQLSSSFSGNNASSNFSGGVMKRRLDRVRQWGTDSTPAKRAHRRFEERSKKRKEVLALQKARMPKSTGRRLRKEPSLKLTPSQEEQGQGQGQGHTNKGNKNTSSKKLKASNQSPPIQLTRRVKSSKSLR